MRETPVLIDSAADVPPQNLMLHEEIAHLTSKFCDLWNCVSDAPTPIGRTYSARQQRENEQELEEVLQEADHRTSPRNGVEKHIGRMRNSARNLVLKSVDDGKRALIGEMLIAFSDAGDDFVRRAREFDENLRFDGIFQALRNLWIINSMQEAFGRPICVNPSGLAYSLLYAYTDSYLDADGILQDEKEEFGNIFARRLAGIESSEDSQLLSKISMLVRLIELEFPRRQFPGVFESLLEIHHAQQESLQQQLITGNGIGRDILSVSVRKGGTSVVADAYVTKGLLTPEETGFAFGYGVFLQFIDDLQDVKEDLHGGSETLFTRAAREGLLDSITSRLIQYLHKVLFSATPLRGPRANALTELILQGSLGLIMESIALNPERFNEEYVRTAELFSPLGFESIRRLHSERFSVELNLNAGVPSFDSMNFGPMNGDAQERPTIREIVQ